MAKAAGLGLALTMVAHAQGHWWELESEALQRRGKALVAQDPYSSQGWNLIGVGQLFDDWNQKPGMTDSFLRSYRAKPNQQAAVYLAQIAMDKRNFRSCTEWALKALDFPSPSLHALEYFETATFGDSELASLATSRVAEVRAHRSRWLKRVEEYSGKLRVTELSVSSEKRLPADEGRKFALSKGELVATSSTGKRLWSVKAASPQLKLVATGPRVFAIGPENVQVYDAAKGSLISSWPSGVILGHKPEWHDYGVGGNYNGQSFWNAWEHPEWLAGADGTRFYLNHGRWLCVLRQKDAGGWGRYFQRVVRIAQATPDLMVLGINSGEVEVRDAATGKLRWTFEPYANGEARLLGYNSKEVVVGLLNLGQIAGFSTNNGKLLWTRSHLQDDL